MLPVEQQTILITGATDGLGRALAHELARLGATVVLHGRDKEKTETLLQQLRESTGNTSLSCVLADFARLSDVLALADQLQGRERLDALVNNAGIGILHREESEDGYELTFQVDYLAGYVLAARLAPLLVRSAPARIVNVSSYGQSPIDFTDPLLTRRFDGIQAYGQAKLAQIMHAIDLSAALSGTGVTANAVHPAPYMPTNMVLGRFPVMSTIEQGMRNVRSAVIDADREQVSGRFFNQSEEYPPHPQASDPAARAQLRALSLELTGVPFPGQL